jgi:hypothetical protein
MTPTPKSASAAARADAEGQMQAPEAEVGPFVLNLCSSTTPMALPKAEQEELRRFSFFVSRRFEEGRERFRLHMGYFATLAEAEEWLGAVRDIYPGAWAGEAPGRKLRARALAAAAAQAQHAAGPPPLAVAAPAALPAAVVAAALNVPTVAAAEPAAAPPDLALLNIPTLQAATPAVSVATSSSQPPAELVLTLEPDVPRAQPSQLVSDGAKPAVTAAAAAAKPPQAARIAASVKAAPLAAKAAAATKTAPAAKAAAPATKPAPAPRPTPAAREPVVLSTEPSGARKPAAEAAAGGAGPAKAPAGTAPRAGAAAPKPNTLTAAMVSPDVSVHPASAARKTVSGAPVPRTPVQMMTASTSPAPVAAAAPAVARGVAKATVASAPTAPAARPTAQPPRPAAAGAAAQAAARPTASAVPARTAVAHGGSRGARAAKLALPDSNVREVLAALDETTGETRMMPAPAIPDPESEVTFTDTQVLRLLETRRADGTQDGGQTVESGAISLLKPDDTSTVRALKQAVVDNAPVWFAVQLQWSVQPVELARVPPLAIFSAYTLYTVEGSRDGRKWYGLRLGFFSDAIAAKQVAYYVRSEFNSVAVVPVSPQERTRASDVDTAAPGVSFPRKTRSEPVEEFKLIDSDQDATIAPAVTAAVINKPAAPRKAPSAARNAPRGAGRVRARERRGPQSLEETLEILGAGELQMDNGDGESLNESGVRHLRVEVQKNTPFSRLLERLSEKVRKP